MTIAEEMTLLYQSIGKPLSKGDPHGLMDDLDYRSQWLARSAELVGECQVLMDRARGEAGRKAQEEGISGNAAKDYVAGACAEENRLLTLANKLNSVLVHQIDAIRTMLSFEKQSMEASRYNR